MSKFDFPPKPKKTEESADTDPNVIDSARWTSGFDVPSPEAKSEEVQHPDLREGFRPDSSKPEDAEELLLDRSAEVAEGGIGSRLPGRSQGELPESSREDLSPKEWRDRLKGLVEVAGTKGRNAPVEEAQGTTFDKEQIAYREARDSYMAAYKESLEKKTKAWSMRGELAELKKGRDEARLAYAGAMERSAIARLKEKGRDEDYIEKAMGKYRGIVRFNELVRPDREAAIKARVEALDAKGPAQYEKVLGALGKGNQWLEAKLGKNGARITRAVAVSALITGGAALTGAFGAAGVATIAGYGAFRAGKSFVLSFVGASAGGTVGKVTELVARGSQKKAKAKLGTLEADTRRADFTYDSLVESDSTFAKLTAQADDATVAKKKMAAQIIGAFVAGAGLSWASAVEGVGPHIDTGNGHSSVPPSGPDKAPVPPPKISLEQTFKPGTYTPPGMDVVESGPHADANSFLSHPSSAPETGGGSPESLTAHVKPGLGYENMVKQLHEQLRVQYPDPSKAPVELQKFLNVSDKDIGAYAHRLALEQHHVSDVISQRATLTLTPKGDFLFADQPGGIEHHGTVQEVLKGHAEPAVSQHANGAGDHSVDDQRAETARLNAEEYARVHAQNEAERQYHPTAAPEAPKPSWIDRLSDRVFGAPKPSAPDLRDSIYAAPHLDVSPEATTGLPPVEAGQAFTNHFGVRVDASAMHVYHRADGTLFAYGGTDQGALTQFAQDQAEKLKQPIFLAIPVRLDGQRVVTELARFSVSPGGEMSITPVRGLAIPIPQEADRLIS